MRTLLLAIAIAWSTGVHAQAPAGPVVVDRVVATVGDRVITASDVLLETALAERDPSPVPEIQQRRSDPLDALIDLALARAEAGDISVYAPSTMEVRDRLAALRARWADPRDWTSFLQQVGHGEDQLAGALYSRMVAERYIQRNVTGPARGRTEDPAHAAQAAEAAYARWSAEQRQRVRIRSVPALSDSTP